MIVRAAGMRHVADAVAHDLVKIPVVIAWTGEKRQPVVNQRERCVWLPLVKPVIPVWRLVAVAVGSWIRLDEAVLGVAPVRQFVKEHQVLARRQLVKNFLRVTTRWAEAGIAEQIHAMSLAMAGL